MLAVVFIIVFSVFELGWVFYTYTVLADAANEGVRKAIVTSGGDTGTITTAATTAVQNFATTSLHDVSAMTVTVSFPDGDAVPPHKVKVDVSYTYVPYLNGLISSPTMHAYAEGAMVRN